SKSSWRLVVRRFRPVPSAFTTQTSSVPFENVIRPLSVDTFMGEPIDSPVVEETSGLGAREARVGVARGTAAPPLHEARSPLARAKAASRWHRLIVSLLSSPRPVVTNWSPKGFPGFRVHRMITL